jgi:hypothetical protein
VSMPSSTPSFSVSTCSSCSQQNEFRELAGSTAISDEQVGPSFTKGGRLAAKYSCNPKNSLFADATRRRRYRLHSPLE